MLGSFLLPKTERITASLVGQVSHLIDLSFSEAEKDTMLADLEQQRNTYQQLREIRIPNSLAPSLEFNPIPQGFIQEKGGKSFRFNPESHVKLPHNRQELAFFSIPQLAGLLRSYQIT
jgi:hypothetical protein